MKKITINGQDYVRHWLKWYWVIGSSFLPISTKPDEDDE